MHDFCVQVKNKPQERCTWCIYPCELFIFNWTNLIWWQTRTRNRETVNQAHLKAMTETCKEKGKPTTWWRSRTGQWYLWRKRIAHWIPGQIKKGDFARKQEISEKDWFREERLHLQQRRTDIWTGANKGDIGETTITSLLHQSIPKVGCSKTQDPVSELKSCSSMCYGAPKGEQGTAMVQHSERK
jgi:hypothetical protein